MNVEAFLLSAPIEFFLFGTVTFRELDITAEEANKRMHSWLTNVGSDFVDAYIRVLEPQKRGTPHFHFLIRVKVDVRTGFNWQLYSLVCGVNSSIVGTREEKAKLRRQLRQQFGVLTTNQALKDIWALARKTHAKYGLGRCEFVPIKTNEQGVSRYMGKYLTKEAFEEHDGRKTRVVTYSRNFARAASTRFNWNSPGAWIWRKKLEAFAINHSCFSLEDLKAKFGPRWAYKCRMAIWAMPIAGEPPEPFKMPRPYEDKGN